MPALRSLHLALLLVSAATCLPSPHELVGRSCERDADCGAGLICHRSACAKAGSIATFELSGPALLTHSAPEGNVEGGAITATALVHHPFRVAGTALPFTTPVSTAASGRWWLLDGASIFEVSSDGVFEARASLPEPRTGASFIGAGGRLFVLGGRTASGVTADVQSAEVLETGELGPWRREPELSTPREWAMAASAGGFVYVIGGAGAGVLSDVLRAAIDGAGHLGPWETIGALPLTTGARSRGSAAIFDGQLYVVGGTCAASCEPLRAALQPDGSLGPFERLPAFPPRANPAVVVTGGALRVLGGRSGSGVVLDDTWVLPLGAPRDDGWRPGPPLPMALEGAAALGMKDELTIVGGREADGGVNQRRLVAQLDNVGLGSFTTRASLPSAVQHPALVTWNGAVYAIGGSDNAGRIEDTVLRASSLGDGGLSGWTTIGRLPAPRGTLAAAAWGDRLYLAGGCARTGNGDCLSIDEVSVADLLADGGVSAFRPQPVLPREASKAGLVVHDGWAYLTGGQVGYQPTLNQVVRARLDARSGTLGPFTPTVAMPSPLGVAGHRVARWGSSLFVVGGAVTNMFGTYLDEVLRGELADDGTVTSWRPLPTRLPEERAYLWAELVDGALYVGGGCNEVGSSYCGTFVPGVVGAALLFDGGIGPFTQVSELERPRAQLSSTLLDGLVVTIGGYDGNPKTTVEAAPVLGRGRLGRPRDGAALPAVLVTPSTAAVDEWVFVAGADGRVFQATDGAWSAAPNLPAASGPVSLASTSTHVFAARGPTLWSAKVTSAGLEAWRDERPLPESAANGALTAGDGRLFAIGGGGQAGTASAAIALDGAVGEWETGPRLPAPRAAPRAAVSRGQLFVLGGLEDGDVGDVLFARLDSLGKPTAWARTAALDGPRAEPGFVAADGLLYVAGGRGPLGVLRDVLVAPVLASGGVGSWTPFASLPRGTSALAAPRERLLTVSAAETSTLARFTPAATGRLSARLDLGSEVRVIESLRVDGPAGGRSRVWVRLAGADGAFGAPLALGEAGAGDELLVGAGARFVWLTLELRDEARIEGVHFTLGL